VIVPRAADQFENAAHVQRELLGLRLHPLSLSSSMLRLRLRRLLASTEIANRVGDLGCRMRAENGPANSADLIEGVLRRKVRKIEKAVEQAVPDCNAR
jgi:UDP:flavonoid glycosyltransferase YjiC (YdhE family)